jgi:hypothetical protein
MHFQKRPAPLLQKEPHRKSHGRHRPAHPPGHLSLSARESSPLIFEIEPQIGPCLAPCFRNFGMTLIRRLLYIQDIHACRVCRKMPFYDLHKPSHQSICRFKMFRLKHTHPFTAIFQISDGFIFISELFLTYQS